MTNAASWRLLTLGLLLVVGPPTVAQPNELTVQDTRFLLNGEPFPFAGISFFNAIYNPAFNKSPADRKK